MTTAALTPTDNKDQIIAALRQENQQLRAYQTTVHKIASNKDMSYSDRVLWIITLDNHTNEMINCKPFQPNISRLRQESGVGTDTATKFFGSMVEAGAIKYTNKAQQDENHSFSSVSTVIPLADHARANTRAAALRIKQREETTKRRIARKLIIQPCPACGSENLDDAYSAIIPICRSCNHVTMERQETVPSKNVRIIEEEIIPPTGSSHDFSEVTDHEWEEIPDESANSIQEEVPSHDFSGTLPDDTCECGDKTCIEWPVDSDGLYISNSDMDNLIAERATSFALTRTPDSDTPASHDFSDNSRVESPEASEPITPPSHDFSEGMRVDTPLGLGTISIITTVRDQKRCSVILATKQPNGAHYGVFGLEEIHPVVQGSFSYREEN